MLQVLRDNLVSIICFQDCLFGFNLMTDHMRVHIQNIGEGGREGGSLVGLRYQVLQTEDLKTVYLEAKDL